MDGLSQARHAATLAVPAGTWLRDEEAAGSPRQLYWARREEANYRSGRTIGFVTAVVHGDRQQQLAAEIVRSSYGQ
jgi:hypothetical protein